MALRPAGRCAATWHAATRLVKSAFWSAFWHTQQRACTRPVLAKLSARTPRLADPPKTCDSLIDIGGLAGSHSIPIPTMARGKQVGKKAATKVAAAAKAKARKERMQ